MDANIIHIQFLYNTALITAKLYVSDTHNKIRDFLFHQRNCSLKFSLGEIVASILQSSRQILMAVGH